MKYIKAKIVNGETKIYPSDIDKGFLSCVCADIISEADTVEELCDEFVEIIKPKNDNPYGFMLCNYKEMIKIHEKYPNNDFMGAIWTDKGLKYIAKMNESGELELI